MYKRILSLAAVAAAITTPAFMGCSSSDTTNPGGGGNDAGTGDTGSGSSSGGKNDSGSGETGTNTDGGAAPQGSLIFPSETASVFAVTADNYVIFTDSAQNNINAIPIAGGQPTAIAPVTVTAPLAFIDGKVLYTWSNENQATGAAKFFVWTAANGVKQLSTNGRVGVVASDGTNVIWEDNVTATTADIVIAKVDGTGKTVLKTGVDVSTATGCTPRVQIAGAYAAAAWCNVVAGDAGAPDAGPDAGPAPVKGDVSTFTGATWTEASITTGVFPAFVLDKNGTKILTLTLTGGLVIYPIAGGTAANIDSTVAEGAFSADGSKVFYTTTAKALKTSPSATSTPTTLVASGFPEFTQFSPDGNWLLGDTTSANVSGLTESDFLLASTQTAGAANVLTTDTSSAIFGDAFTADSSHVLFYTAIANGAGNLLVAPTAGGAPVTISATGWLNYALSGSKVMYADNGQPANAVATVDMSTLDTATGATKLLVSGVDPQPTVSPDKANIVYSWHLTPGATTSGIYVMPSP